MEKYKKNICIFVPGILVLLKMLLWIPVIVSGGFAGETYQEYVSLFEIISNKNMPLDADYISYDLLKGRYILEGIFFLLIGIVLVKIIFIIIEKIKSKKSFPQPEEDIEF